MSSINGITLSDSILPTIMPGSDPDTIARHFNTAMRLIGSRINNPIFGSGGDGGDDGGGSGILFPQSDVIKEKWYCWELIPSMFSDASHGKTINLFDFRQTENMSIWRFAEVLVATKAYNPSSGSYTLTTEFSDAFGGADVVVSTAMDADSSVYPAPAGNYPGIGIDGITSQYAQNVSGFYTVTATTTSVNLDTVTDGRVLLLTKFFSYPTR